MARGNYVDSIVKVRRFNLVIVYPFFRHQSFKNYDKISVSKKGMIIGYWLNYRDYLGYIDIGAKLIRRSNNYLFFKVYVKIQKDNE